MAAMVGVMRNMRNIRLGSKEPYGSPNKDRWGIDIESAIAEMLVAREFNQYWHTVGEGNIQQLPGDAGFLQVRWTSHKNGHLLMHQRDKDDVPYILVIGSYPEYVIQGWVMGKEGKQAKYWQGPNSILVPRPCYCIPQSELRPIDELREVLTVHRETIRERYSHLFCNGE